MITVLRLGHRPFRDKRITTHVCLVARALGAQKILIEGKDLKLKKNIEKIVENWGGEFEVEFCRSPMKIIENFQGVVVHLTMYGLPFKDKIDDLKDKKLLVVVGSEKVFPEIFKVSDHNLSVSNQPHSEVSSLAIFLYELGGRVLDRRFKNAKLKILPSERKKLFEV
ncbi:MAG: tRNA (cytidine(56)-2'-O)-methyltransferase [Candidatus Methanofastidiosia archaeon]